RIRALETELAVHRRAAELLKESVRPKALRGDRRDRGRELPVEVACRVLDVSSAGYYAWRCRPLSARAVRHAWLTNLIREVHVASYGSYGANRVHAELVLGRGIQVGHNAVAMLMQRAGIAGRNGARRWRGVPGLA